MFCVRSSESHICTGNRIPSSPGRSMLIKSNCFGHGASSTPYQRLSSDRTASSSAPNSKWLPRLMLLSWDSDISVSRRPLFRLDELRSPQMV
ncbi:hypothetical protein KC328_g106 [Hortaea werneckii]|nr:hypothetical protein KC328_g106 [Hortaea werneckii]